MFLFWGQIYKIISGRKQTVDVENESEIVCFVEIMKRDLKMFSQRKQLKNVDSNFISICSSLKRPNILKQRQKGWEQLMTQSVKSSSFGPTFESLRGPRRLRRPRRPPPGTRTLQHQHSKINSWSYESWMWPPRPVLWKSALQMIKYWNGREIFLHFKADFLLTVEKRTNVF